MINWKKFVAFAGMAVFFAQSLWAQCAMCKGTAETTGEDGKVIQAGINTGILYLLLLPFILIATIAVLYIVNQRKVARQKALDQG